MQKEGRETLIEIERTVISSVTMQCAGNCWGQGWEERREEAWWVGRGQTKGRILYTMHIVPDFARVDGELLDLEQKSSMIGSEF